MYRKLPSSQNKQARGLVSAQSPRAPGPAPSSGDGQTPLLFSYFRSGWAFLIPYLAAYLLYAWLNWPVKPAGTRTWVPSLLHLYWALHALHLALASEVILAWWRRKNAGQKATPPLIDGFYRFLPWLCLALIFWIPGIYLEWPSDPWEHLRRINEWHTQDIVTTHSAWKKSGYFFAYSLTGFADGLTQQTCLNLYYVGACLALGWQYYRLARAVGLGDRASFVFVLLGVVTLGNNVFSFYRYYGLSTSIFAQLGAVAVTRIAVNYARSPARARRDLARALFASAFALVLITFNHPQGLGIVALSVAAIIVWKLCANTRPIVIMAVALIVVLSSAIAPRLLSSPTLDALHQAGWLSRWYGFNLLSSTSPAFDRAASILGWFGALNLLAGIWLLRVRHLAGFLTVFPVCLLALPHAAVPIALLLHTNVARADGVLLFQRLLFAIPVSLALVAQGERTLAWFHSRPQGVASAAPRFAAAALLCVIFALTTLGGLSGARFWHALFSVPDDLSLRSHVADVARLASTSSMARDPLVLSSKIGKDLLEIFSPSSDRSLLRIDVAPISSQLEQSLAAVELVFDPKARFEPAPFGRADVALFVAAPLTPPPMAVASLDRAGDWIHLANSPPVFDSATGRLLVANPSGIASSPFSRRLLPIESSARYRISVEARAVGPASAHNYLAVAWYDANHALLLSRNLRPMNPTYPAGWINGDYSYFGLTGTAASSVWSTYTVDFGMGESAEIPREAAFFRVGALLNQDLKPAASTQIRNLTVTKKPPHGSYLLAAPDPLRLFTSGSTAGLLSGHWRPYHAAIDHVGSRELGSATMKHFRR